MLSFWSSRRPGQTQDPDCGSKREENYQEIFQKPRLIEEIARNATAGVPQFERPLSRPKSMVLLRIWHKDQQSTVDEGSNSTGGTERDWFAERGPKEDELTDEELDGDDLVQMQRNVKMGIPVFKRPHMAEFFASLVKKNTIACLQIVSEVQDHVHTLAERHNYHPDALRILRFADHIPFRLHLIFHLDCQVAFERISATIEYLQKIHSDMHKRSLEPLENSAKESLWSYLSDSGDSLDEGYLTLKSIVEHVNFFNVNKKAQMDDRMLDKIVESTMGDTPNNPPSHEQSHTQLFIVCYSHLSRFNHALHEVVDGLLYFGALLKRAHCSLELWKVLFFSEQLDISLLTDWLAYWIEVLTVSTQAFKSLVAHFEKLEQSN
ncbi:hypothetical protein PCASD_12465 [Puccinia coronata f. sp. avenae]|uniref:Uncharacterized protein n=1 Tax=Puccinia coronata f. sp. avenae TaxID=200324 RepID=A0A2N5U595_9BASI|nr:hypothetical protein PCASD_12465 [Puccinia coronata f. sp. avenae]